VPKILEDEKIFLGVLQVVAERGYTGATTKQMADAADISEMTLFRKYGNKAQLVKKAIAFIVVKTNFTAAAEFTGDVHKDLLRVVKAYQDTAVRHGPFFFTLFSEFSRHPELVDSMDEPLNIFRKIGELIARYQAEGVLKECPPLHAVAMLLAPLMYISSIRTVKLDNQIPPVDLSGHVIAFLEGHYLSN